MQATFDDANLILRLYELRREETLRKARTWFGSQFINPGSAEEMMAKYPPQSQESTYLRMVISYWDMAASFVTAGILNQELFFESGGELLFVWEKIRPLVPQMRAMMQNPKAWANLEKVGNAYIEEVKSRGPNAYEHFQKMLATMAASTGQS